MRSGKSPMDTAGGEKLKNLAMGLIFAGPGAKTADLLKLNVARRMEEAGATADDILQNTGWFKGMEGKWKFEIPDNASRFSTGPLTGGQKVPVTDVLDHPDLYAAYPYLRGMKAQPMPSDVPQGAVGMFQGPLTLVESCRWRNGPNGIPLYMKCSTPFRNRKGLQWRQIDA